MAWAARGTLAHISCVSLHRFQHCALPRRTPGAEHFNHFHQIFVEYNFFPADQPWEPAWSPTGFSSSSFCTFILELTQQGVSGWTSICSLPSKGFPAPCKLGYLLGHQFSTSITHSLVFMLWCKGALFKGNTSSQMFQVLRDQFPSCDFPGQSCADLWQLEMWLIICVKNKCFKNNHCLWSWKNYVCWRKKEANQISA